MHAILFSVFSWFLRTVVIKFVVMAVLFLLLSLLVPMALSFLMPFLVSPATLDQLFNSFPSGVWYFWNIARLDFGLPLMISAIISRFLIRRLPVVG